MPPSVSKIKVTKEATHRWHFYRPLYLEVKARRRRAKNVLPTSTKQPLLPFILERFIPRQNVKAHGWGRRGGAGGDTA